MYGLPPSDGNARQSDSSRPRECEKPSLRATFVSVRPVPLPVSTVRASGLLSV